MSDGIITKGGNQKQQKT